MSDDLKVSRKYRELGAEEPPRALDDAILAAASRQARPWTRRWAIPLSLAAVVMLSVTVTLRLQHEQPGIEAPVPPAKKREPVPAAPAPVAAEAQPKAPAAREPVRKSVAKKEPEPFATAMQDKVATDKPSAAAAAVAPAPAAAQMSASPRDARAAEFNAAGALAATPERELERIAELRKQGLHDEADKALEEFRKRYPDYTIPEAMRLRVERR